SYPAYVPSITPRTMRRYAGRTAVAYLRVSTEDQGTRYSIPAQADVVGQVAASWGAAIVETFTDDESARTRPGIGESFTSRTGWRALTAYLAAHPVAQGGPSLVLVKDYTRFGRDATDGGLVKRQL